jgi:hypothetical protein
MKEAELKNVLDALSPKHNKLNSEVQNRVSSASDRNMVDIIFLDVLSVCSKLVRSGEYTPSNNPLEHTTLGYMLSYMYSHPYNRANHSFAQFFECIHPEWKLHVKELPDWMNTPEYSELSAFMKESFEQLNNSNDLLTSIVL